MNKKHTTIVWFRRDFRLRDHAALCAAAKRGAVIPVFILEPACEKFGSAPRMRLEASLDRLSSAFDEIGLRLILRRGVASVVLHDLLEETGADGVFWSRRYDADGVSVDTSVKSSLTSAGAEAESFPGSLMFEPWTVKTGQGGPYRVYSPFWKAVRSQPVALVVGAPTLSAPAFWPATENLMDWQLSADMQRGKSVVMQYVQAGEREAQARLETFLENRVDGYKDRRDFMGSESTSDLSDALSLGEISPAQCWHAARRKMQEGSHGAEHFLKELVWREFAWHLMWHFPNLSTRNWRPEWDNFRWSEDESAPSYLAWCAGRTGEPIVDAAMRELYVTGKMHNRARMITASYLTKHLGIHWKLGLKWFENCLIDWDPASNAMGWQWVAGCGPDAAPYFRIFNPATQAEKFDPNEDYRRRWLAEHYKSPSETACAFFDAAPAKWGLSPTMKYPDPIITLKQGRTAALAAYEEFKAH